MAKDPAAYFKWIAEEFTPMLSTFCKSSITARFGFHQIQEAYESYQGNMSAGKVILQAELSQDSLEGPSFQVSKVI